MNTSTRGTGQKELPAGWKWVKLGDVCQKVGSGSTPRGGQSVYKTRGTPLIRSQNVLMNGFTSEGLVHITEATHEAMSNTTVEPEDVLLNITGASIGRVCVVPSDICPANVNQHVSIIRTTPALSSTYLSYFISSGDFQRYIMTTQAGGTRQALTKSQIQEFTIPVPPLEEQKRIVSILNDQMAAVEAAKKAAEERLEAAKALPAAFLRDVYPSNEDELPEGWKRVKLGDVIANVQPGFACGARSADGVVQLRMNNVTRSGKFDWDDLTRIPPDFKDMSRYWLQPNDVLFNNTNSAELVGKSALFESFTEEIVYSNHFSRLRPDYQRLDANFLAKWLLDTWTNGTFESICNRWVGQAAVPKSKLLELHIPLPPLQEQKRIAARLNDQLAAVETAKKAEEEHLDTVEAMPAALLRKAFSGEL